MVVEEKFVEIVVKDERPSGRLVAVSLCPTRHIGGRGPNPQIPTPPLGEFGAIECGGRWR
jgi:hypothetical protein